MQLDETTEPVKLLPNPKQSQKMTIASDYLQNVYSRMSLATVLIPLLGTIVAIVLLWKLGITTVAICMLVSMYALTVIGVEVGFHRLFSHNAFQTTTAIRVLLAILGSMAAQGGVIYWAAHHRRHHQYTDQPDDPHSPHNNGDSIGGQLRGLWHAHVGWTLNGEVTNSMLFAKDLLRDPAIAKVNQLQQIWVLLGLVIPTVIAGVVTSSWIGALEGFLWGGLVRIFLGHQIIWSTNSICHVYGNRPLKTDDRSTNNLWLAIPSFGQSLHNNHHAFPNSAIAGLKWWQIDPGSWIIGLLSKLGLVWNIKAPTPAMIQAKKNCSE